MASVDSPAEGPREEGSGSARQGQPAVVPATQGSESAQEVDASVVLLQPDQDSHVRDATRAMRDTGELEGDSTLPAMQAGGGSGQAGGDATPPEDPHKVGATDAPPFFSPLNEKTHRGAAVHHEAASAADPGARGRKQGDTGEERTPPSTPLRMCLNRSRRARWSRTWPRRPRRALNCSNTRPVQMTAQILWIERALALMCQHPPLRRRPKRPSGGKPRRSRIG